MTRTREWLLYNAVEAWLVNYGNQPSETVEQYKQLREELKDVFMASLELKDAPNESPPPRKRTNAKPPAKTV
jgi:pyruvate/oxaloacetate carboxyltransferase